MPQHANNTLQRPAGEDIVLDPDRPICDAHHHLWNRPDSRYLLPDFLADAKSGHNIVSSVFVEWRSHYRETGPIHLRPVGETAFAAEAAQLSASLGDTHTCAAIISHVDLAAHETNVAEALDAHEEAGQGHFRGIRHVGTWDASEIVRGGPHIAPRGLYASTAFRNGLGVLARRNLVFDAWVFQPQHEELIDLATAFPDLSIVYNHTGGLLGVGPYAGRTDEMFASWKSGMKRLAEFSNIRIKLGGLGMARSGFAFYGRKERATSKEVAETWRPYIETAIELFGADRSMFESNFPVDAATCSYATLWNAFKRIAHAASPDEKSWLFHDTAAQAYSISLR